MKSVLEVKRAFPLFYAHVGSDALSQRSEFVVQSKQSSTPDEKRTELLVQLQQAGISAQGPIRFAGYDPPSTLPALRRNEVIAELAELAGV